MCPGGTAPKLAGAPYRPRCESACRWGSSPRKRGSVNKPRVNNASGCENKKRIDVVPVHTTYLTIDRLVVYFVYMEEHRPANSTVELTKSLHQFHGKNVFDEFDLVLLPQRGKVQLGHVDVAAFLRQRVPGRNQPRTFTREFKNQTKLPHQPAEQKNIHFFFENHQGFYAIGQRR